MKGKGNTHKFNTGDFSVVLGVHDLSKFWENEEGRSTACANTIHIHPDWNVHVDSWDADIAVLELVNEVQFNKFIRPICIADRKSEVAKAQSGTVVGFGKTENGRISDIANKLDIPIYDYLNCTEHSEQHRSLVSHRTFCGGPADGRGVCLGDSGGGVYVSHNRRFYLRGLVSASLFNAVQQCDVDRDAIFTDATKFYGWIESGGLDVHAANRSGQRSKRGSNQTETYSHGNPKKEIKFIEIF